MQLRGDSAAYPLTPISPSHNSLDRLNNANRDGGQEMPRPPSDRTSKSVSAHSPARPGRPRVPYHPQPSDIPINPDSPVSEQAAELIHEFIHPHHHSREDLLAAEEERDEAGGDAPAIAKELEEMQGRVWWRRPSAIWYALISSPRHNPWSPMTQRCDSNHSILRRFLSLVPFVLAASTMTAAPRIQVITHLVCKTLRPEYTDRSGENPLTSFLLTSDDEEMRLCNADPVVRAASAEFLTCKFLLITHLVV